MATIDEHIWAWEKEFDTPCDNQGRGRKLHGPAVVETPDGRRLCERCKQKSDNYR